MRHEGPLLSIQYLRGIAAALVVFQHAIAARPWFFSPLQHLEFGGSGVDIFFVISGFIMYYAARGESAGQFVWRRFVRVAPLYWIATIPLVALDLASGKVAPDGELADHLAKSLLFVPTLNLFHPTEIWPYLIPGWTLNFEVFFYAVFALSLLAGRVVLLPIVVLTSLVAVGLFLHPEGPVARTYTHPLLLEFLAGLVLGRLYVLGSLRGLAWMLPVGAVALLLSDAVDLPRLVEAGIPAVAIVAGALSLERGGRLPTIPFLKRLGDSSYALYLFHTLFGVGIAGAIVKRLPLTGYAQFAAMLILSMAASLAVGLLAHRLIERPLLRRLSRVRFGAAVPKPG